MRPLLSILLGLVRPSKGIDGAGSALKWLWAPLTALLLLSVVAKVAIATPMSVEAVQAQVEAQMEKDMESWPEEERARYEKEMAAAEESGDFTEDQAVEVATDITSVAAFVFGALGAVLAVVYITLFFFVAAKTWANPVGFTTMMSVASFSLLPHAFRNVVQAVYMAGSGVWLQHSGLGALVAPADVTQRPGAAYAVLSQIDIWVLWGLALLLGGLLSKAVGLERKRAVSAMVVFVVVTGVLQAVPTIIGGLFAGAVM
ncbi:hypothetical protein EG835_02220 [bacterium]|nr:hypothetical protein [bacterium]